MRILFVKAHKKSIFYLFFVVSTGDVLHCSVVRHCSVKVIFIVFQFYLKSPERRAARDGDGDLSTDEERERELTRIGQKGKHFSVSILYRISQEVFSGCCVKNVIGGQKSLIFNKMF